MPYNGSGSFSIINTFVPNTTILSAAVNQNFTDIATGLSDVLTRDNQAGMTAAFRAISGTLGSPGITFNSDTTSGLFLFATGIPGMVSHSLGMLLNTELNAAISATVQAGGSNYAVGDTITLTGGTAITQSVFTVATLSGSAVATVTLAYSGFYGTKPSNPVSQGSTSGIGTSCTLNVTYNDLAGGVYVGLIVDQVGNLFWQKLGASSYMSGLMNLPNGLQLATSIGGTNIASVIGSSFIVPPGGYLSPISSTTAPIPTTDSTAITRIYWTPMIGNNCPIWNGVNMVQQTTAQIFCDLTAGAQTLHGIFDVYMFMQAGVPTLGFSPNWSAGTSGSITAGSCARGTGTGGTAFTLINGVRVNTVQQTVNNGATTYTMGANLGTLLGSIYVDATAGQINCHRTTGQSRSWSLWNAYNRVPIILGVADPTASWTNTPTTWRQTRADATNFAIGFCGLQEEELSILFNQYVTQAAAGGGNTTLSNIGIGFNVTNAATGMVGSASNADNLTGTALTIGSILAARTTILPFVGINQINIIEQAPNGTTNNVYQGTTTNMLMTASWRG